MAEDSVNNTELSVTDAAAAISALLDRKPEAEAPEDTTPESPQSAAPQRAEDGNTEAAPVEPGPSETTALETPIVPAATPTPVNPDLDARMQEASKSKQDADTARNQLLQQLNTLSTIVPQMEAAIRGEFSDIKNIDDLENVARLDPDRYNRFVFQQARLQQAQQAQRGAQDVIAREKNEEARKAWAGEQARLHKLMPDLADPVKGSAIAKKLQDYALKSGVKAERLTSYTADEFIALNKAMQFDDLQSAQAAATATAKAKAASAPPVQKPGTTQQGANRQDKLQADFERLHKTGRVDDAAAVFRNLLN